MKLSIPLVSLTNADNKNFCCHCPLIKHKNIETRHLNTYGLQLNTHGHELCQVISCHT